MAVRIQLTARRRRPSRPGLGPDAGPVLPDEGALLDATDALLAEIDATLAD